MCIGLARVATRSHFGTVTSCSKPQARLPLPRLDDVFPLALKRQNEGVWMLCPAGVYGVTVRPSKFFDDTCWTDHGCHGITVRPPALVINEWVKEMVTGDCGNGDGCPGDHDAHHALVHATGGFYPSRSVCVKRANQTDLYFYRAGDEEAWDVEMLFSDEACWSDSEYLTVMALTEKLVYKHAGADAPAIIACEQKIRDKATSMLLEGASWSEVGAFLAKAVA